MDLFVVIDTKGSGRLLGVFDSRDQAEGFTKKWPNYYRLYNCRLNEVNEEVLDWVDNEEQRQALKLEMTSDEKG